MEAQHGIDVSWLHHSHSHPTKGSSDKVSRPGAISPKKSLAQNSGETIGTVPNPSVTASSNDACANSDTSDGGTPIKQSSFNRAHLYSRSSTDKLSTSPGKEGSVSRSPPSTRSSPSRKSSWISGITSKFSSASSASPHDQMSSAGVTKVRALVDPAMPIPPMPSADEPVRRASLERAAPAPLDETTPYVPAPARSSQSSFLQSALRRLSSSSGQLPGLNRSIGTGGICERRIMNVDPNRERCRVRELDASKLRRVAFCVDVEIANGPRYHEADAGDGAKHVHVHGQKPKEQGAGEVLKHPMQMQGTKETDGLVGEEAQTIKAEPGTEASASMPVPPSGQSKKKEKKKRSEVEREERKERRRRQAEANGSLPVEMREDRRGDESSPSTTPSGAVTPSASDRPTTDPLRIYRRCCQLRETSALKKITDQLASPTCSAPGQAGVVSVLELSGYWMHLADVITLGDWLAVVPVKKLLLENCGLTDEALRVVLAGLLASRTKIQRRTRQASRPKASIGSQDKDVPVATNLERHGAIEKLSLKNNPQIGREGWRSISLFVHMSRSLRAIDISSIPLPQCCPTSKRGLMESIDANKSSSDTSRILADAMATRLAGSHLEELVMSDCQLSGDDIRQILKGAATVGVKRLGFAKNHLDAEGLQHIANYITQNKLEGLDLGGNPLGSLLPIIASAVSGSNPLYALSLADCDLTPSSLSSLLPALVVLPNFRFIDLSHNRSLFASDTDNALGLLRRYLPRLHILKRIHLADVSLTSDAAIALAEILPESPSLAHLSIIENPALTAIAKAQGGGASQEEACALYASLMAAVRVSTTIICIDVDVPAAESSDIVKALAKQVVAYCLRNMERGPMAEYENAAAAIADPHGGERQVVVPDVLLHLVGHLEGESGEHDSDDPAPDDDYVIGGSGVVKALGICLGSQKAYDSRRPSGDVSYPGSGETTSRAPQAVNDDLSQGRAKDMSKNLLGSARKIRARLRPAIIREAERGDDMAHRRILFLDQTLERMIQRFEDEFPECRLPAPPSPPPPVPPLLQRTVEDSSRPTSLNDNPPDHARVISDSPCISPTLRPAPLPSPARQSRTPSPSPPSSPLSLSLSLSRQPSDLSLSSRAQLLAEARMHRFGQQVRRDILRPQTLDHAHGTTGEEGEEAHLRALREKLEGWGGGEIEKFVGEVGVEGGVRVLREKGEVLRHASESSQAGKERVVMP